MSDYTIRPMTLADGPQAAALWSLVFGDEEALVVCGLLTYVITIT